MKSWICATRAAASTSSWLAPGPAVGDVGGHRVVEQDRVLRHDADGPAQAELGHVAHVLAVDADGAAADLVEAEQEPHQGRLARARRADHRHLVPGRDLEADALEDRPARVVVEARRRRSARCRPRTASGRASGASAISGCEREQAVDVLEVGQRLAQLAVEHAQEVERLVELEDEGVDQHDVADAERAGDDVRGGDDHDRGDADRDDRGLAGVEVTPASARDCTAARS